MTRARDISNVITDADLAGDIDVDGTTNLDNTDIDGTLNVQGETTLQTHLNMGDSDIIKLGASADLQIQHDGSDSKITDSGTGNLVLDSDGTEVRIMNGSEFMGRFQNNDAVKLFFDNSKKFETVTGGVTITGTCTATTFSGSGASLTNLPASGTFQTAVASAVQSSAISVGTSFTTISAVSVTVADANDRVVIFAPTHLDTQSSSTSGQGTISIFRGTTNLGNNAFLAESARLRWFNMLMAHDTPGAGTHTYSVEAIKSNGSITANGGGAYSYIIAFVETV